MKEISKPMNFKTLEDIILVYFAKISTHVNKVIHSNLFFFF